MSRLDNWQNNLAELIESKRNEPFVFANYNCLVWASLGIQAVIDRDILAKYHGKYKTEKSAATLLRKIDKVTSSKELLEKHLNTKSKAVAFARMGDIVLVNPASVDLDLPADIDLFGPVPGICYGYFSYFVGEHGLVEVETLRLGETIWVS